jgi:hypothetical protein
VLNECDGRWKARGQDRQHVRERAEAADRSRHNYEIERRVIAAANVGADSRLHGRGQVTHGTPYIANLAYVRQRN